ncbi:MAG: DNA polymerase [Candidatus Babeliales bacterium]
MRVLVNYGAEDKNALPGLAHILRKLGYSAVSSMRDMTIGELMHNAKLATCDAIICCNEQTMRYLVPGDKPTADKWRGSRLNFELPVIIVNKLMHLYTVPHGQWLLEQDLLKLKHAKKPAAKFTHKVMTSVSDFKEGFDMLSSSIAAAFDVETKTLDGPNELTGGPTLITCASWTGVMDNGTLETRVLPLIDYEGDHWRDDKEYALALMFMRSANQLPMPKSMHNGMYDCTHSIVYHAEPENYCFDTMAMAHAEFSELPKTLDFVASYLLYDYIFWKDDADSASKTKDQRKYWAYNGKDTWHTARIMIEQLRNSPAYAKKNFAESFPLTFPSLYCNFEGVRIDPEARLAARTKSEEQLEKARKRLHTIFADPGFNPGSWQQVEKYVYSVFGAKKPKIGKSKSCTDEKNLKAVGEQHPILTRITDEILDYREAQKAIGTYYDFKQLNGRLLYALNPFGTETGRMACSASSFWVGTQIQNIPGYAKLMLVADDGFELFEADNKQSEGRTTAYYAKDEKLIAALEDAEKDFYKTLGTMFFGMPYEEVTDFFRNKVLKRIVHGTNYVMGAGTFIENIGMKILYETAEKLNIRIVEIKRKGRDTEMTLREFAKSLLDVYHTTFPGVRRWYKDVYSEVQNTGYLTSVLGHKRRMFGDITKNHNMFRTAVAHKPQNLSVAILNMGMKRVYRDMVLPFGGDFRLKAQIHDSLFGQWRIGMAEKFAPMLLERMRNPVMVHGRELIIPVDVKTGHRWAEKEKGFPVDGTVKYKVKA